MPGSNDKAHPCPRLPSPLQHIGARLPVGPVNTIATRVLGSIFAEALKDGSLDFLENREIAMHVDDLGFRIGFTVTHGRLETTPGDSADAMISGPFAAFTWLAAKRADADTLFFHRHLLMEGDTEIGLSMKNLLDATGLDQLPQPMKQLLQWLVARIPAQPPGARTMPGSPTQ